MKKILIALAVLFFLTGCQSKQQDSKSSKQVTQEEKQEEQKPDQEQENAQREVEDTVKADTKETSSQTKETKQQAGTNATPPSVAGEAIPPTTNATPTPETPPVEVKKYVTVAIDCKTILNNMDTFKEQYKSFVPSNGIILADTKVEYTNGDTVLSLLKKVTKEKGIRIINQGGYISNIANLNQMGMQNGQGGWMYQVNGTLGDVGADSYTLSNGDVVRWRYTCYPGDI